MRRTVLNRTLVPVLLTISAVSICLSAGLGYYAYRLNHEVNSLQGQTASSRVLELLESAQAQSANNPQVSAADPFASLFAAPLPGTVSPVPDPFQQMNTFRQQMDNLFSAAFQTGGLTGAQTFAAQPDIQIRDTADAIELVIPVQEGANLELTADVQDNRLLLAGTLNWREENQSAGQFFTSNRSSRFSRTVPLPNDVDATGVVTEHRGDEVVVRVPRV